MRFGSLAVAGGWSLALAMLPAARTSAETKRIFAVPPIAWDNSISLSHPAVAQGQTDVGNLTGGIVFGMSPAAVNAQIPTPAPDLDWSGLPMAPEYPEDVRYFWVRLDLLPALDAGIAGCTGADSYAVFLFRDRRLFRISWRLLSDAACPSPRAAAENLYGRWLGIDRSVALATHYRAGNAEVVEITDPRTDELIPYRWSNRGRR